MAKRDQKKALETTLKKAVKENDKQIQKLVKQLENLEAAIKTASRRLEESRRMIPD